MERLFRDKNATILNTIATLCNRISFDFNHYYLNLISRKLFPKIIVILMSIFDTHREIFVALALIFENLFALQRNI